jgi:hypothetical protein
MQVKVSQISTTEQVRNRKGGRLKKKSLRLTQTGKRVVKVSIIFSYWLRPPALSGTSPDMFVEAEHNICEFLNITINKSLALQNK